MIRRYDTDPSRAPTRYVHPRAIFDPAPHRNKDVPMVGPLKHIPDDVLISTLVAHGQPLFAAQEVRRHGGVRFAALRFWCDVQDAAQGDKEAAERVDYHRWAWAEMRKMQLISERPDHTIGLFER